MEQYENLLAKIELALSLGDEPSDEVLSQNNMMWDEYNILIMLNSATENIILQERNNGSEITRENALIRSLYDFIQLLGDFGMMEDLSIVLSENNIQERYLNGNY